jgi:DNA-3-methyladenine glycosylase I
MKECSWSKTSKIMEDYHNFEWCIPSYEDRYIFEMLTLEGAQAGLSWNIVLSKRDEYKKAFNNFDIKYCSSLNDKDLEEIKDKYNVIKNILKIKSVKTNALAVIKIQNDRRKRFSQTFCKQFQEKA